MAKDVMKHDASCLDEHASTRPADKLPGFDFTGKMHLLCDDITSRMPQFRHIDMDRVAITFSQARKRVLHGLFATTTPMRFKGGALVERRRGRSYTFQRVFDRQNREMLYIISFYPCRFMKS